MEYIKKMEQLMEKKPDSFAENKSLLPYGDRVGAPSIVPDNVDVWKDRGINKVNKQLQTKFEELKKEYQRLIEEYEWNELVYKSKFSFEPVIGETYHLYVGKDGKPFLSLIAPDEWEQEIIGSFTLNSEQKWIKQ
mgnify:CR=1 FL=1